MADTSASTTVTFTVVNADGSANNSLSVELDDAANNNRSSFQPGEACYFLVHTNPINAAVAVDTTLGTVTATGTKSVAVAETLTFVQSASQTLAKVPDSVVSTAWVGRSGGTPSVSGSTVSVPDKVNGVLNCGYTTTAKSFRLSDVAIPSGLTEIEVLVVVTPAP